MNTQGFGVTTTELDLTFDLHGHSSVDSISQFHQTGPEWVQAIYSGTTDSLQGIKTPIFDNTHSPR